MPLPTLLARHLQPADPPVRVNVVGLGRGLVGALRQCLELASDRAPMRFELDASGLGEIALVDGDLAADLDDEEWSTLFGDRPVVAVIDRDIDGARLRTPYRLSTRFDDDELLAALNAIPELRRRGPGSGRRPVAPSTELLADDSPFAAALLRNLGNRDAPALLAGYACGNGLLVDFARGEARVDRAAWERLRADRELPRAADRSFQPAGVRTDACPQRLDTLVWACGLAARDLPLWGAPADWRRARLEPCGWVHLKTHSRMPVHLHLAERLADGPCTPAMLRSATRVDERELRAFLQAGLFLGLLRWLPSGIP